MGEARDAPVHPVEEHREEDGDRGGAEVAVHRLNDAVEGGEEGRRGEGVRQDVDALGADGFDALLADFSERLAVRMGWSVIALVSGAFGVCPGTRGPENRSAYCTGVGGKPYNEQISA